MVNRKNGVRVVLGAIVCLSALFLVSAAVSPAGAAGGGGGLDDWQQYDELTVGAAHGSTETSGIVVFDGSGDRVHANRTYDRYFDVDPVAAGRVTVEYVGSKHVYGAPCAPSASCTLNVIERLNLSTGEATRVYARYTPGIHNSRWHDADRVDEDRYLVAGIDRHRAFIVNTTTGVVEWQWEAQSHFGLESGGPYPNGAQTTGSDWTHINDVELLPDGRIMVSVRNQDQVVFIDRERGVLSNWTLGADDDYDVLNEQHNPDYIPAAQGGPAVVVADSHNDRAVEYQRVNGTWEQTWFYGGATGHWVRDADRLPNGNTLVSDSSTNRVYEVAPNGSVVWSAGADTVYEAERLGTGDESAGGPSAASVGLEPGRFGTTATEADTGGQSLTPLSVVREVLLFVRDLLPSKVTNAVLYVLPEWVRFAELAALGAILGTVSVWAFLEYRWSSVSVSVRLPVGIERDRE